MIDRIAMSGKLKKLYLVLFLLGLVSCGQAPTSNLSEEFPILRSAPYGMEFSFIPQGIFRMGSPDDEKGRMDHESYHWVEITKEYWIQTTEVTRKQWHSVMEYYPDDNADCKHRNDAVKRDDHPVVCVNWHDIQMFIDKLNLQLQQNGYDEYKYRLPTESEWEYAARAYTETRFSVDGQVDSFAWSQTNGRRKSHPVAELLPNFFGLYDVHGNVFEWVSDWFGSYPETESHLDALKDPEGPDSGIERSVRGGSWASPHMDCRSALRASLPPGTPVFFTGFRLARTLYADL